MNFHKAYYYREDAILGKGAFGVVYAGWRTCDRRLVAIKKFPCQNLPCGAMPTEVETLEKLEGVSEINGQSDACQ